MFAYHVITDRPIQLGEQIIFDDTHDRNIVYCHIFILYSRGTHYLPFTV